MKVRHARTVAQDLVDGHHLRAAHVQQVLLKLFQLPQANPLFRPKLANFMPDSQEY
jgi:hypothetical protein